MTLSSRQLADRLIPDAQRLATGYSGYNAGRADLRVWQSKVIGADRAGRRSFPSHEARVPQSAKLGQYAVVRIDDRRLRV
jgi:hypothetical protein